MKRHCLSLELRPDPAPIAEYIQLHAAVWPDVQQSIRDAGVLDMQIYCNGRQLFMIMDTVDDFSPESKARLDAANPKVDGVGIADGQVSAGRRRRRPHPQVAAYE